MIDESTEIVLELTRPELDRLRTSVVYSASAIIKRSKATLAKGKMNAGLARTCLDRLDKIPTLRWKSRAKEARQMHADIIKLRKELRVYLKGEVRV